MNQGIQAFRAGQTSAAIRSLELAGDADPTHDVVFYYLGMILNDQGSASSDPAMFESAMKALKRGIEANPEGAELRYQLGVALYELSRLDEAIAAFDEAIKLKGGHGDASLLKGKAHLTRHEYNEAQRAFHQAIRLKPELTEPYQALAMLYRRFHQAAPAAHVLKNAIENHEGVYEFQRDLGQIYAEQGQYDKAIPLYEDALKLNPSAATLMFLLANAHLESKDYRRAEVHLKSFLRNASSSEHSLERKAAKQLLLEIKKH
jgi:tetratricopeptide (TPR) repeat protein